MFPRQLRDPETGGALPRLIVDGRTFTWDQIGRMMMKCEGFTLNAIVEDTIKVVGGPLADGRLGSQASSQPAPAGPALVVRPGASNRQTAKRRRPTRSWPPSPRRLDALIEEATYFDALQIRLDAVVNEFETLPADVRTKVRARLGRIQVRAQNVGRGFSDAVDHD